jgi:hypothetical protein
MAPQPWPVRNKYLRTSIWTTHLQTDGGRGIGIPWPCCSYASRPSWQYLRNLQQNDKVLVELTHDRSPHASINLYFSSRCLEEMHHAAKAIPITYLDMFSVVSYLGSERKKQKLRILQTPKRLRQESPSLDASTRKPGGNLCVTTCEWLTVLE